MDNCILTGDNTCRRFFLGIDGGGTKTTALLADENGQVLTKVVGGTINYCAAGLDRSRENMRAILRQLREGFGVTHFASVFIGMSALYKRATDDECRLFCDGVFDADCLTMDSDLFIALEATGESGATAVGICGTGSMVAGRLPDGRIETRGGYGYLLGDEGSAYRLAQDGIRAAVMGKDGAGTPTALSEEVLRFWDAEELHELIDRFYAPPIERDALAAFAAAVTRAARNGDAVALSIEKTQAALFAGTASSLLHILPDATPLYVYGGVFEHDEIFTQAFSSCLPTTSVLPLPMSPAAGALHAARQAYTQRGKQR